MERMDIYERKPAGMEKYLSVYGWYFSKAMAQFAVERMFPGIQLVTPERYAELAKGLPSLRNAKGYDGYFTLAKFRFIFTGFNELETASLAGKYLEKCVETAPLTHFYSDCIASGTPIIWEDLL